MAENSSAVTSAAPRVALSEDWLATIVGLVIVFIILSGLLGPGPQTADLKASSGQSGEVAVLGIGGWQVSATIGGKRTTIANPAAELQKGKSYVYTCSGGQIALTEGAVDGSNPDKAQLRLVNNCDQDVSISYRTNAAIPWPIFGR